MSKVLGLIIGLAIGAGIGVAVAVFFAPVNGRTLREHLQAGYRESLDEARNAAAARRRELEAEYTRKTGKLINTDTPAQTFPAYTLPVRSNTP